MIPPDNHSICFEINSITEKRFFICIYKPPSQINQYPMDSISNITDHYSDVYNNHVHDFHLELSHTISSDIMDSHNYFNLLKGNSCFKGQGLCIDLTLINIKYCFKNTTSFETDLSDNHHII